MDLPQKWLLALFGRQDIEIPTDTEESFNPMFSYYAREMQLSSDRKKRYKDYIDMGEDVLVGAALGIYADEATQFSREKGATVWVEPAQGKDKYAQEIMAMFESIGLEDSIWGLARALGQYGDVFDRPLYNKESGVILLESLDPEDVERVVDRYGRLVGYKFSNYKDDLAPWDILHYRLIGRRRSVKKGGNQYGDSMIEECRRVWRQLKLLEDALTIYRLDFATKHRVFKIDVGNSGPMESLKIIKEYRRLFRKRRYYNPDTNEWTSRYSPFTVDTDLYWPVRPNSPAGIEYIGGDADVGAIADVEYFKNKLAAALKIPRAYLGGDEYSSVKVGLAQLDIRLARTIKRLQRGLIVGLTRLAQIHLSLKGIEPNPAYFQVKMQPVSSLEEEQRMQSWEMAVQIAQQIYMLAGEMGLNREQTIAFVMRKVLGMADEDFGTIQIEATPPPMEQGQAEELEKAAWNEINKDPGKYKLARTVLEESINGDMISRLRNEGDLPPTGAERGNSLFYESSETVALDGKDYECFNCGRLTEAGFVTEGKRFCSEDCHRSFLLEVKNDKETAYPSNG